jgi:bla regulator protein blaR1
VAAGAPALSVAVDRLAQPFASDAFPPTAPIAPTQAVTNWVPLVLGDIWALGFLMVLALRLREWRRIRAALRQSIPAAIAASVPVRSSPALLEPGIVGLWRPVLLVPAGIETHLTPRQLEAVLAHECCHVRRRDNLTAAIHMLVEAVFWFHPLVWWVGARLVEERERACDEHVLQVCGEPQTYAESILNVCKLYVESPLACVSGVTGSGLKKRIAAIMGNRVGRQLTLARRVTLAAVAVLAVALPLAAGMATAPLRASAAAAIRDVAVAGQATAPQFDVVSVKPCEPKAAPAGPGGGRGAGVANGGTASPSVSPGRVFLACETLASLINTAYAQFAGGQLHPIWSWPTVDLNAAPAWTRSDRFTVEATADPATPLAVMRGPMLQAILEDRFKLRVHRETREVPVYELTIAKGGPKLTPFKPGSCVPDDDTGFHPQPLEPGQRPCRNSMRVHDSNGPVWDYSFEAITLDAIDFSGLDRPLINRTGITGLVAFHLTYSGQDPGAIASAMKEQLGLDLRPARGPHDFVVLDHAERPTPDGPAPRATGAGR